MAMRIGMIGDGNVGTALTNGLTRAGYEVRAVGKEPPKVKEVGQWAEVIVLAVPFTERENALRTIGTTEGKIVVDVTNAMTGDMGLAVDPRQESGAEQVQEWARGARVVKAFNTVFAQNMVTGTVHGETLTALIAGDDEGAKRKVIEMANAIGFDPVDAGPLKNARWLETLGLLNITLGYGVGLGPSTGFRYVHEGSSGASRRASTDARTEAR
ncbi:MAG TPA: NAD(P)-binding domain-containing protein [Candidatus Thermoplasmatota archaeon]|nr:NAD(P)-binding domain-containing protein [Candidatus Thermoplasmatota archaeon]